MWKLCKPMDILLAEDLEWPWQIGSLVQDLNIGDAIHKEEFEDHYWRSIMSIPMKA